MYFFASSGIRDRRVATLSPGLAFQGRLSRSLLDRPMIRCSQRLCCNSLCRSAQAVRPFSRNPARLRTTPMPRGSTRHASFLLRLAADARPPALPRSPACSRLRAWWKASAAFAHALVSAFGFSVMSASTTHTVALLSAARVKPGEHAFNRPCKHRKARQNDQAAILAR